MDQSGGIAEPNIGAAAFFTLVLARKAVERKQIGFVKLDDSAVFDRDRAAARV